MARCPQLCSAGVRILLLVAAAVGLVFGWDLFYFLTDDAYIAFRYVANAHEGRGLVWNPAPFLPVEGYTSFLWVILLRVAWRLTGIEPPDSSNWISLAFGAGSLWLAYRFMMRMRLPAGFERDRLLLVAVVLVGALSNRTFLAWLSSGLETALFNFLLIWFVYEALAPDPQRASSGWVFRLSASAGLAALARPDGMLAVACALAILPAEATLRERPRRLLFAFPLAMVPAHLFWRRWFYGEWLPNTYYAKYTGIWPESGLRYAASFVLEYGVWVWLLIGGVWLLREAISLRPPRLARLWRSRNALAAVGLLLAHWLYYTFVIGGDHFEYRVYSHLVVLFWLTAIWMLLRIRPDRRLLYGALAAFLLASLPIPWLHWARTSDLWTRRQSFMLKQTLADSFPPPLDRVVAAWDEWQRWLIDHNVCRRHQEHRVFQLRRISVLPTREEGARIGWDERAVFAEGSVGVVGWVLPNVAIIDALGLNDRVIARLPPPFRPEGRQMAHDRMPPRAYVACFHPNVYPDARTRIVRVERRELTDDQIRACEARDWRDAPRDEWGFGPSAARPRRRPAPRGGRPAPRGSRPRSRRSRARPRTSGPRAADLPRSSAARRTRSASCAGGSRPDPAPGERAARRPRSPRTAARRTASGRDCAAASEGGAARRRIRNGRARAAPPPPAEPASLAPPARAEARRAPPGAQPRPARRRPGRSGRLAAPRGSPGPPATRRAVDPASCGADRSAAAGS
jgi:arabinofuranosyltransferase